MIEDNQIIVPFLKWAGGKRWLVSNSPNIFPKKFDRYIEPFLGSGAVFFHLKPNDAILSDSNQELVETYKAVQNNWKLVVRVLRKHQRNHCKSHYYRVRDQKPRTNWARAAQFIYLNRTCWNGLYRVNTSGKFNVPIGTKENVMLDTDDFEEIARLLRSASIVCSDFEAIVDEARRGDFLFVDPPYTVKHNHNGFLKYNENIFSWDDQKRLSSALKRANRRGVQFLMTNANHESVRELYEGNFELSSLSRASVLAGNASFRSRVSELVVHNY